MLLNEIFNTDIDIDFKPVNSMNFSSPGAPAYMGKFKIGNVGYMIHAIKMEPNRRDMIHRAVPDQPIDDNTWFLGFTTDSGADWDTNTGNAITVLGIVVNAYEKLLTKIQPSIVYFGCDDSSPKRKRIYAKLASKIMSQLGGTIVAQVSAPFFGQNKFMWIIKA